MSYAYGGVLSALEIAYTLTPVPSAIPDHRQDLFLAASADIKPGHKYIEREEVHAIYEKKRKLIAIEERDVIL